MSISLFREEPSEWVSSKAERHQADLRSYLWRVHPFFSTVAVISFAGVAHMGQGFPMLALALVYAVILVSIRILADLGKLEEWLGLLALLDILAVAASSLVFPDLWHLLLVVQVLVISMGWAKSAKMTGLLIAGAAVSMGLTGLIVQASLSIPSVAGFALGATLISVTGLWSVTEVPLTTTTESLESARTLVWQANLDSSVTEMIGPVQSILGCDTAQIVGRQMTDFVQSGDKPALQEWAAELIETGSVSFVHNALVTPPRTVRTTLRLVETQPGRLTLHGVTVDISKEWRARPSPGADSRVIERMQDGMLSIRLDENGRCADLERGNRSASRILGLDGTFSWEQLIMSHPDFAETLLELDYSKPQKWRQPLDRGKQRVWVSVHAYSVHSNSLAVQLRDVTELVRQEEQDRYDASHDGLTGLATGSELKRHLSEKIRAGVGITAFFVDLDGFKQINDEYGHAVGDRVLTAVAQRLKRSVNAEDLVARIGGDEFAGYFAGLLLPSQIEAARSRLERSIGGPVGLDTVPAIAVSASVGFARLQATDDTASLLRRADLDMYHRKRQAKLNPSAVPTTSEFGKIDTPNHDEELRRVPFPARPSINNHSEAA